MASDQKTCNRCEMTKHLDDFPIDRRNRDGRWGICRECQRADKRAWQAGMTEEQRKNHNARARQSATKSDYDRRRDPAKITARRALQKAVSRGKIDRKPCEICGGKAQGHHDDYSKPLSVRWLCPIHHAELHRATA